MAIDYEELERELKNMRPRQRLYELVKHELKSRGHWKGKPRGGIFKPGADKRRKRLN